MNDDVIDAVRMLNVAMPRSITPPPISRPIGWTGVTSPYPTVVTVCRMYQKAVVRFSNSGRSERPDHEAADEHDEDVRGHDQIDRVPR